MRALRLHDMSEFRWHSRRHDAEMARFRMPLHMRPAPPPRCFQQTRADAAINRADEFIDEKCQRRRQSGAGRLSWHARMMAPPRAIL